jgi:lipopolysaccharide heptosyltransferase II
LKKILIIRFSSIGDIVLTSPVVRCVKEQMPHSEIHYLTKRQFEPLLAYHPQISKIHTIEKDISEITKILKAENFDYIIDLHNNLRSTQVKLLLACKAYTFKKLNFKKWLLVQLKHKQFAATHVVERYLKAIAPLGIVNDNKGLDFYLAPDTEIPKEYTAIIKPNTYITFVIGAKHNTKKLPTEKIISVCKKLNQTVVIIGGKEDEKEAALIQASVGSNCINTCGKLSLHQSAFVIKNASKVISHDTGMMHIAAAFQKNIISIWGSTTPELGFAPYLAGEQSKMVQVQNLNCRPCSKIGYAQCPKKHFKCMNEIDESEIII